MNSRVTCYQYKHQSNAIHPFNWSWTLLTTPARSLWERSNGKPPRHQTHISSLHHRHISVMSPYRAWSQGGLPGLHHRHRGPDSVLQLSVSGTVCNATGCLPEAAGCHSGRGHGDVGCSGLCTTSARPSGMSRSHQDIVKGSKTYFWSAESCLRCFTQQ